MFKSIYKFFSNFWKRLFLNISSLPLNVINCLWNMLVELLVYELCRITEAALSFLYGIQLLFRTAVKSFYFFCESYVFMRTAVRMCRRTRYCHKHFSWLCWPMDTFDNLLLLLWKLPCDFRFSTLICCHRQWTVSRGLWSPVMWSTCAGSSSSWGIKSTPSWIPLSPPKRPTWPLRHQKAVNHTENKADEF